MSLVNVDVSRLADGLFGLVDDIFTSDEERAQAKSKILEMQQKGELAQIAVNLQEAQHESLFVAGWRPAIGWTCAIALFYTYIFQPFAVYVAVVGGLPVEVMKELPDLDMFALLTLLGGMLGLGGFRSLEKIKGANKRR